MNDADRARIKELLASATERLTRDQETARAWLIGLGIYTEDGQLTAEFGGIDRTGEELPMRQTHARAE